VNFSGLVARVTKFAADNSPAILTAIGVTGTIATAYLASKASFQASYKIFYEEQDRLGREMTTKEVVRSTWKLYVPAAAMGCTTIACIIMANRIGTRRAAAMAAMVAISEKAFDEYKAKVVEKIGERKEQAVRDEIAQDRVTNNPPSREVVIMGGGDVLCHDMYSGRYFHSDMETIRKAQNDINGMVLNDMYASLSDFYYLIGLTKTGVSDEVGWNVDKQLDLKFSATMAENGRPCMTITFAVAPVRDYNRLS